MMRNPHPALGGRWRKAATCAALLTGLLPAAPGAASSSARPNIVVIMADDLGFSDLGCYGSEIATPNLDRMAAEGLRFRQFYNTAKCVPARQSLMSGWWHNQYRPGLPTVANVMKAAGYRTLMAGKWHIDGTPRQRGFDRYFGHLSGATDYFLGDETFLLDDDKFAVPKEGFYTTDANTDYAIRFLEEARPASQPFFLYIAYNAPHYPLQAPKEEIEKYRGKYRIGWDELRRRRHARQIELGVIPGDWRLSPRPEDVPAWDSLGIEQQEKEDLTFAVYAAMIDRLDQNVGRLLRKLDDLGVADNTVVMFCSDNGGCPFQRSKRTEVPPWQGGGHLTYHAAWAGASNTPFRWYKQNAHEGGIASPFIVRWPVGLRNGGGFSDEPAHLVDILPTCAELAGGKVPPGVAGISLLPVWRGRPLGERTLYWQYSKNRGVRAARWKLVSELGGPWELYDVAADRTELNNLIEKQPERALELEALWDQWAAKGSGKGDAD